MIVTLDGKEYEFSEGEKYEDILKRSGITDKVLGIRTAGVTRSLAESPFDGEKSQLLTFRDTEGRLIYERSLRYIFVLAVHQLFPNRRVRVEHSVGDGVYCEVKGSRNSLTIRDVHALERNMQEIVRRNIPFVRTGVSKRDAMAYYENLGQSDKVDLLAYRPYDTFTLYRLDDMMEYFYGVMVPSTGYVDVFALHLSLPGLVLQMPGYGDGRTLTPMRSIPKVMNAFAQSAKNDIILRCSNTADLNAMVRGGEVRELIRINEAMHDRAITRIADSFMESGARVLLIAGPSSSGKTTFANRLSIALKVLGMRPVALSLDDYYKNRDAAPLDENGEPDFERLDALDVPLFNDHLVRLLQGEPVCTPRFDFKTGKRSSENHLMHVDADQPIIIEGIHGLNDELTADVARNLKFKVYVSALTTLNLDDHNRIRTTEVRLLRRIVRDYMTRGTTPEDTMKMWHSVRRGEEAYIFPFQEEADVVFNSSLVYEIALLKKYAYPMLKEIKPESECYTTAGRMLKFLNYFVESDAEDEVPLNSILREFIGGSCFYK